MREIGAYEAKTHLPELLKQVEGGEVVTITRRGKAIARISPVTDARAAADRILALRKQVTRAARGEKLSMRSLIDEGRH